LQAVRKGEYSFEIPEFEGVSESVKDLIRNMITNPKKRFRAEQVL
jgi:calcium-dependent protein kinase